MYCRWLCDLTVSLLWWSKEYSILINIEEIVILADAKQQCCFRRQRWYSSDRCSCVTYSLEASAHIGRCPVLGVLETIDNRGYSLGLSAYVYTADLMTWSLRRLRVLLLFSITVLVIVQYCAQFCQPPDLRTHLIPVDLGGVGIKQWVLMTEIGS